jgi:hypothetical protein
MGFTDRQTEKERQQERARAAQLDKADSPSERARRRVRGLDYPDGHEVVSPETSDLFDPDAAALAAPADHTAVPAVAAADLGEPTNAAEQRAWMGQEEEATQDEDEMVSNIRGWEGHDEEKGKHTDRYIFKSGTEATAGGSTRRYGAAQTVNEANNKAHKRERKTTVSLKRVQRDIVETREDGTQVISNELQQELQGTRTRGEGKKHMFGVGVGQKRVASGTRKGDIYDGGLTTVGKGVTDVGVTGSVGLDKDGARTYGVDARAKASLLEAQHLRRFGEKGHATELRARGEVLSAEATAGAEAAFSPEKVRVKGAAKASATLVGGSLHVETEAFTWKMLGEEMAVRLFAGVDASILAEAKGEVELVVDRGDKLGARVTAGGEAFAGARAGVEVGGKLRWILRDDYTPDIVKFAKSFPGTWDDRLADKVPADVWKRMSSVLFGSGQVNPRADLLIASAGVEGSAGIGGSAKFNAGVDEQGMISVSGELGGTVGLGAKVKTDLKLGIVNGVRFVGLMAMRGSTWLMDKISDAAEWFDEVTDMVRQEVDDFMEAEKAKGGFSGAVAGVADFLGDKVFNLW